MSLEEKSWQSLADDAQRGLSGQGSLVEAMRRLDKSTVNLSKVNIGLSCVLVLLAIVQIVVVVMLAK